MTTLSLTINVKKREKEKLLKALKKFMDQVDKLTSIYTIKQTEDKYNGSG